MASLQWQLSCNSNCCWQPYTHARARKYATRFLFKYHSIFKSNPNAAQPFRSVSRCFLCVSLLLELCSAFNFHLVYFNVIFDSSPRFVLQGTWQDGAGQACSKIYCHARAGAQARLPTRRHLVIVACVVRSRFAPCTAREVALIRTFKPYWIPFIPKINIFIHSSSSGSILGVFAFILLLHLTPTLPLLLLLAQGFYSHEATTSWGQLALSARVALSSCCSSVYFIICFILERSKRFLIEFLGDTFDCLCAQLGWKLNLKWSRCRLLQRAMINS